MTATAVYYTIFNSDTSGTAGGADLASAVTANYQFGYSAGVDVIGGFILISAAAKMPYQTGAGGTIAESNTWLTAQTATFFVAGFPMVTNGINIASARASALAISQQANYQTDQKTILPDKTFLT